MQSLRVQLFREYANWYHTFKIIARKQLGEYIRNPPLELMVRRSVDFTPTPNNFTKYNIIQICHASEGNMMECFPEGARGKTILPRGDIPSCYPHWHGIFVLLYRTNPICNLNKARSQMAGDSHNPR